MNCKPGDLAVVVWARNIELVGRVVVCVRLIDDCELVEGHAWSKRAGGPTWLCETQGGLLPWEDILIHRRPIADVLLRPIRPQPDDAEDEMLLKTGLPERNGVAA